MKKLIVAVVLLLGIPAIAGCTSNYGLFSKAGAPTMYCKSVGWGLIGTMTANSEYQNCSAQLLAQGYLPVGTPAAPTERELFCS